MAEIYGRRTFGGPPRQRAKAARAPSAEWQNARNEAKHCCRLDSPDGVGRSSHLFRQLQGGLLLPLRRSTFQKEMGEKWPFRPTGGRPFKFQKLAAISSERGSERGPPYSSTGNKVCNKSRGRKIFALQKARGARSVHRFEKYYFLPRRPDSKSRCLSSLFWWLDATEGNRLPLLVERKINFTEPLCLPCSLLCFISCPTLYGKRQPATKRARRALRERITFSVMDFLRDDDN